MFHRLAIAALCLLFVAATASAQDARKASHADTAVVTAIDSTASTLTIGEGAAQQRFLIEESTRIRVGADAIALDEIAVGDRVTVTAAMEGATAKGLPVADTVQVVQTKQPAPETPTDE